MNNDDEPDINYNDKYHTFMNLGVNIELIGEDNFLKIKETLTRIGVSSNAKGALYQSCHILHKRSSEDESLYSIMHFKEMFKLDGRPDSITIEDVQRRNAVAKLLEDWGMLKIINVDTVKEQGYCLSNTRVIPFKDKLKWNLVQKYSMGPNNN